MSSELNVRDEQNVLPGASVLLPVAPQPKEQVPKTKDAAARSKHSRTKTTSSRFAELNNFVDFTMRDLKSSEIQVWFILFRDTRDGRARTSQSDIARRAGLSERTIRSSIKSLEKHGLLVVTYHGGLNRGASCYRVISIATPKQRSSTS